MFMDTSASSPNNTAKPGSAPAARAPATVPAAPASKAPVAAGHPADDIGGKGRELMLWGGGIFLLLLATGMIRFRRWS